MAISIGDTGGIGIAAESTWNTAVPASRVWQSAVSATLGVRKQPLTPGILGTSPFTTRRYNVAYSDGNIVVAYNDSRAVIGPILAGFGNLTTDTYEIGNGSAPDSNSQTIWVDKGGILMQHSGCKGSKLSFDIQSDREIRLTAEYLGATAAKQASTTITEPAESGIVWENDISTVTFGGAAIVLMNGTIDVAIDVKDSGRHGIGSSTIKEPQRVGRSVVTASLNLEFTNDTGDDTIAQFDDFLTGTAIGDIVIGDMTLVGAYCTGEDPPLQEGITQFTMNVVAETLEVVTTA